MWLRVLVVASGALLSGCTGFFNPVTRIGYGPFLLENGKDVSIVVEEATYDPQTHAFHLKGLQFADTASIVRQANVLQMDAINRQLETHGRNIAMILERLAAGAGQVLPFTVRGPPASTASGQVLSVPTPWGNINLGNCGAGDPAAAQKAYAAYLEWLASATRGAGSASEEKQP